MKTNKTPKEDLMKDALAHYEEASKSISHWRQDIPLAIKAYYSQQKDVPNDEKGFKEVTVLLAKTEDGGILWNHRNGTVTLLTNSDYPIFTDEFLKEYASQQKDVPSDEEIEKNAREYADKYGGPDFGLAFKSYREGAKDIRDNYQPKQIDWYEFDKWVEKKCFRVPYDGSNDFYDQVQVKHYNECREWFKSKLK